MNNKISSNKVSLDEVEITLKGFFRVLRKNILPFIIVFIIIFVTGIVYSVIVAPQYGVSSQIKLNDSDIYYNNEIYKYFPQEANNLWILPTDKRVDYAVGKLDPMEQELRKDSILNEVLIELNDSNITKKDIIKSIDTNIDRGLGILTLTIYAKNPELANKINQSLLNSYIKDKKAYLEAAYNDFSTKIDLKLIETSQQLDSLSKKPGDSATAKEDLKNTQEEYNVLSNTRQNMLDNKEFFINRIEVVKNPEVYNSFNYSNYLRNILLSIVAAFIVGALTVFIVNYFKKTDIK